MNPILIAAGLLGFSAIGFGAYADHGLRETLDADTFRSIETALRYHLFHALALLAIGMGCAHPLIEKFYKKLCWAASIIGLSTVVFSFSIYASVILNMPDLTILTPFGGMGLMLGWLFIVWAGLNRTST